MAIVVIMALAIVGHLNQTDKVFMKVLECIQHTCYSFDVTATVPSGVSHKIRGSVFEPGNVRFDSDVVVDKTHIFGNLESGKSRIQPHQSIAEQALNRQTHIGDIDDASSLFLASQQAFESLLTVKVGTQEKLGKRRHGDQLIQEYLINHEDTQLKRAIDIWADVESGDPVEIKITSRLSTASTEQMVFVFNNFSFEVDLDESGFDSKIPARIEMSSDHLEGHKQADRIEQSISLAKEGQLSEAAEVLLEVDWSREISLPSRCYLFMLTEKEAAMLDPKEKGVVLNELYTTGLILRKIARELIRLGRKEGSAGDLHKAERIIDKVVRLGKYLNRDSDLTLFARLIGLGIQKLSLQNFEELYLETNNREKLGYIKQQMIEINAQQEKISE